MRPGNEDLEDEQAEEENKIINEVSWDTTSVFLSSERARFNRNTKYGEEEVHLARTTGVIEVVTQEEEFSVPL